MCDRYTLSLFLLSKILTYFTYTIDFRIFSYYNTFCTISDNIGGDDLDKHENKYEVYSAILNQCDKELDEIYHNYALKYNLSDAALWVMYAIYEANGNITQADISNFWFFRRQTINTALKNLEQQGFINLISTPDNRKSKQIKFTDKGNEMLKKVIFPLLEAENNVFAEFTDNENELFVELSRKRCNLLRKFLEND